MGLALSRMIVELYGGRIIAQSDPGSGARFQIVLPVAIRNCNLGSSLAVLGAETGALSRGRPNVRFWHKADITAVLIHVRFRG